LRSLSVVVLLLTLILFVVLLVIRPVFLFVTLLIILRTLLPDFDCRENHAVAGFTFRTTLFQFVAEIVMKVFGMTVTRPVVHIVLVMMRTLNIIARLLRTRIFPILDLQSESFANPVVFRPALFVATDRGKFDGLRLTLVVFQAQDKPARAPLCFVEAAIVIALIDGEILCFANDDLVPATVKRHPRLDYDFPSPGIPRDVETTDHSPSKHHAVNQVALVIEVRLFLQQVANGELLTVEIVVALERIGCTNTAFGILVWLHI
jgi:hypothetical protein